MVLEGRCGLFDRRWKFGTVRDVFNPEQVNVSMNWYKWKRQTARLLTAWTVCLSHAKLIGFVASREPRQHLQCPLVLSAWRACD